MRLGAALPAIDAAVRRDRVGIRGLGQPTRASLIKICQCQSRARRPPGEPATEALEHFGPSCSRVVRPVGVFVGGTQDIERSTRVPILLQQQTVLVAKPAAFLNVSAAAAPYPRRDGGNLVAFAGLREEFHNHPGRRSDHRKG